MLLSGLDSKKYQSILQFKRTLIDNPQWGTSTIIPEKPSDSNREIDEYEEIAVRKLQVVPINFSQEQLCTIANLYHSGESPNKIATKFNCCESTIRKALKNQNIKIVRCRAQAKVDTKTAVKMYEEGHPLTEVGMRFGVSRKTIAQVLQNNGIEIRKRGDHTYTK